MYVRKPEVIALAKLRMDRDEGPGTWEACELAVFRGMSPGVSKTLDRVCIKALDEAERAIADVHNVLAAKFMNTVQHVITIHPEMRSGALVIAGTRFTVSQTLAELAEMDCCVDLGNNFDIDPESVRNMLKALAVTFEKK